MPDWENISRGLGGISETLTQYATHREEEKEKKRVRAEELMAKGVPPDSAFKAAKYEPTTEERSAAEEEYGAGKVAREKAQEEAAYQKGLGREYPLEKAEYEKMPEAGFGVPAGIGAIPSRGKPEEFIAGRLQEKEVAKFKEQRVYTEAQAEKGISPRVKLEKKIAEGGMESLTRPEQQLWNVLNKPSEGKEPPAYTQEKIPAFDVNTGKKIWVDPTSENLSFNKEKNRYEVTPKPKEKTPKEPKFSANQDEIDYINEKAKNEDEARAWLRKRGHPETEINTIIRNTSFGSGY